MKSKQTLLNTRVMTSVWLNCPPSRLLVVFSRKIGTFKRVEIRASSVSNGEKGLQNKAKHPGPRNEGILSMELGDVCYCVGAPESSTNISTLDSILGGGEWEEVGAGKTLAERWCCEEG